MMIIILGREFKMHYFHWPPFNGGTELHSYLPFIHEFKFLIDARR